MTHSEEDYWSIELANLYLKKNIEKVREMLYSFLDLLVYIHEVLAEEKIKVEENEVLSEELLMKFYLHGLSICKIGQTYEFKSKYYEHPNMSKLRLIDLSSLLTVGRAQLETLLMYQHLYINCDEKEEQKLRYFAWIYTALIQRSKTPANSVEAKQQKVKDAVKIENLIEKIKSLNSFKSLSIKQQKSLIETGSVKLFKHWEKIFEESGFSKKSLFHQLYYILSVYSHSEGLSVIQMKSAKYFINNKHNSEMMFMQTFCSLIMTSIMIQNITKKYEAVAKKYIETADKKTKFSVEFISKLSNKVNFRTNNPENTYYGY